MTNIFRKLRQTTGQSIIEYSLLIVLVLAGVYIMSPYVIRSWNANIKGFDDAVKDSYREPIEPSPPGVLDISCVGMCDTGSPPTSPPNAATGYCPPCQTPPCCGYGICEEYERTLAWMTNPIGCEDAPAGQFQCAEDAACCTTPVKLPVPANCGDPRCPDPTEVPALYSCGFEDHVNPPNFVCQYDRNCDLQCQNPPALPNPQYEPQICPQDDINLPTPAPNVTFVEYGKCSVPIGSAPKCQWECAAGFVPAFGASSCECPAGTINMSGVCVIDCTLSDGECDLRAPAPLPPIPTGCGDLNQADCTGLYDALCRWNPLAVRCEQERGCDELLTNVTLFYPTEDDDPAFARCEFFPWCQWTGGGGYCCMAVQRNACGAGIADGSGCGTREVLACCQFDVTGQCNLNGQSCSLGVDCCSNNCTGSGAPGGPFCCLPGQTGVCNGGTNSGNCCSGAANCPGGACVP